MPIATRIAALPTVQINPVQINPVQINPVQINPATVEQNASPRQRVRRVWKNVLRLFYVVLSLVVGGFVVLLLVQWATYRLNNIVTHTASVKGVVTKIGARLDGRIAAWRVEPNQQVTQGDVLAVLENTHLKAAVAAATAEVSRAHQEHKIAALALIHERSRLVDRLSLAQRQQGLADAQSKLAHHALERWQRERDRTEKVIDGVVTASYIDEVQLQEKSAATQLMLTKMQQEIAQLEIKLAQTNIDSFEVDEARVELLADNVEVAKAALAAAEADLDASILRAPGDGQVVFRIAEEGASVKVGEPIATVWLSNQLWLEAWVDEPQLAYLEEGRTVDVRLTAYPGQPIVGIVETIGVMSDVETRELTMGGSKVEGAAQSGSCMMPVRIALPDDSGVRLAPGLTATVGIKAPQKAARGWGGLNSVMRSAVESLSDRFKRW